MIQTSTFIGIDVAKDSFVIACKESCAVTRKATYSNEDKGIQAFLQGVSPDSWCIMEATGSYSFRLALAIHEKGIPVSVVNPLQIKRFAQTRLKRTKTDLVDAELIAEYGERMQPPLYEPPPVFVQQLQQLRASSRLLTKTKMSFNNQLHAVSQFPDPDTTVVSTCKNMIKKLEEQLKVVETRMYLLMKTHCNELFRQLQTIPGISKKSATELIVVTGAFRNFSSAKQFSAFIGSCPCVNESGSSIRGYRGISRLGDKQVRAILYMCTLMAKSCNRQCKELYDRLVAAGKPKKVALIAVMNKLIKQIFGLIKSGTSYSAEHIPRAIG